MMVEMHLVIWTLQYILASCIAAGITLVAVRGKLKIISYQYFLAYAACVVIWELFMFLHRNVGSTTLSKLFLCTGMGLGILSEGFVLVSFMSIAGRDSRQFLCVIPAFVTFLYMSIALPVKIVPSDYGWSYEITPFAMIINYGVSLIYSGACVFILVKLSRKYPALRAKYSLFLIGLIGVQLPGTLITNLILFFWTSFPPMGGIINLAAFILIVFGMRAETREVAIEGRDRLSKEYSSFLKQLSRTLSADELGEKSVKFTDIVEAMGLQELVNQGKKSNLKELTQRNVGQKAHTILLGLRLVPGKERIASQTLALLKETDRVMAAVDPLGAEAWRRMILSEHGSFLESLSILNSFMPGQVLPEIIQNAIPGKGAILDYSKPLKFYDELVNVGESGFQVIALTKYRTDRIPCTSTGGTFTIIDLMGRLDEGDAKGKSSGTVFSELKRSFIERIASRPGDIAVIDCLDTLLIKFGERDVMGFLETVLRNARDSKVFVFIPLNEKTMVPDLLLSMQTMVDFLHHESN